MGAKKSARGAEPVGYLSVDTILICTDLDEKDLDVPQWGGRIRIRAFSRDIQEQIRKKAMHGGEFDLPAFEMWTFIFGVIEPRFGEEHYERLKAKNGLVMQGIIDEILLLTGGATADFKAAEKKFRPGA